MPTAQAHRRRSDWAQPRAAPDRAIIGQAASPALGWRPDAVAVSTLARVRASDDALGGLLQRCVAGRCACGGECGQKKKGHTAVRRLARADQPTLARAADPKHCCEEKDCTRPDKAGSGADAT